MWQLLCRVCGVCGLAIGGSGCAFHAVGVVTPAELGATLEPPSGEELQLQLGPESAPLHYLNGHMVRVDGRRVLGRVVVEDWSVVDGLHGLATWVGPVQQLGSRVGIQDRNSGSLVVVDGQAAELLRPHTGQVVLIEGYVDGPQRVEALYWRPLFETSTPR